MQLQEAVNTVFAQLTISMNDLSQEEYIRPCQTLSNNTIGQHIRHIIELFQCLENGYETGLVNYEKRKRDVSIETNKELAKELLQSIYKNLSRPDKSLTLEAAYSDNSADAIQISTNFYREIAYNLEHTIHHMALIRVGVNEVSRIVLPEDFGVASSTVKYRKQCAQ